MLRKINYTLGIIALILGLILGGYYVYQKRTVLATTEKVSDIIQEVFDAE